MSEATTLPPHVTWLLDRIRDSGKTPRLVQTHISYVVLDGEQVYKLKKPVRFDFIDHRDLDARRHTCEEEVRLNSRLCPDLYLGVVPVRRHGASFSFEGEGEIVDYAVHMRQLPAEGMLDQRIEHGEVSIEMIGAIAGRMARFHAEAATSATITASGGYENFAANWRENFEGIAATDPDVLPREVLGRIAAFVADAMAAYKPLLLKREAAGRVRDGHGDLRADAIWIDPADHRNICIFDCLEFHERYRFSDTGLDVAFLAMDLEAQGRADFADLLIGLYCQASGDGELPLLLRLFKCYRAVVRGKVRSLLLQQPEVSPEQQRSAGDEAAALFRLAASYAVAASDLRLIVVCGLTGSGKSVLAGSLAARLGAVLLSTDVARKELAGVRPTESLSSEFGAGAYSPEMNDRVYAHVVAEAEKAAIGGIPVVLDGTYSKQAQRRPVSDLARRLNLPLLFVECRVAEEVVRQRQERRQGESWKASDANWQVYLSQRAEAEPLDEMDTAEHFVVDTTLPLDAQLKAITDLLT